MEHIAISFNTVAPLFLMIGAGWLAKRLHLLSPATAKEANSLCFKLFMSVLMFHNIYTADLRSTFDIPLLAFCLAGILAEFFIGLFVVCRMESSPPARGAMVQAFFRANGILLGLPIAASLFGEGNVGPVALILGVTVPTFNILAVIALELFRGGRPNARTMVRGVVTNPLILGAAAGFLISLAGLRLPAALESAVTSIARGATPLSLVLMGALLDFGRIRSSLRNLLVCTATRLVIAPAVFLSLAAALGFRGTALCTVLILFAAPVAVNTYTMTLQMEGDADLAGGIVLVSTAASCLTLFLWIWLLKALALL